MTTPRQIIKSFLPGNQHLAEAIIERLRESGYVIMPVKPTPAMMAAAGNKFRDPASGAWSDVYAGIVEAAEFAARD